MKEVIMGNILIWIIWLTGCFVWAAIIIASISIIVKIISETLEKIKKKM